MSFVDEFKTFILRGSVVDLAVGIIIGAAFGKIVTSFVSDLLMPGIGLLIGGVDFSNYAFTLKEATNIAPAVQIKYGLFLNSLIDFLIIAFAIFLVIKGMNALQKGLTGETKSSEKTKICPECEMAIPSKAKRCCHCCSSLP